MNAFSQYTTRRLATVVIIYVAAPFLAHLSKAFFRYVWPRIVALLWWVWSYLAEVILLAALTGAYIMILEHELATRPWLLDMPASWLEAAGAWLASRTLPPFVTDTLCTYTRICY